MVAKYEFLIKHYRVMFTWSFINMLFAIIMLTIFAKLYIVIKKNSQSQRMKYNDKVVLALITTLALHYILRSINFMLIHFEELTDYKK